MGRELTQCGPIRLAWADTTMPNFDTAAVAAQLSGSQLRRYRGLSGPAAERFLVARGLLMRLLVAIDDSVEHTVANRCAACGGDHGRPIDSAGTVALSVSYAGSLVVAAAAPTRDAATIGVDVEATGRAPGSDLDGLTLLFAPRPVPDLRGWTEIEAALKADGRGMRVPPQDVEIGPGPGRVLPGGRAVTLPGGSKRIEVAPAAAPSGYVISVAVVPGSESEP